MDYKMDKKLATNLVEAFEKKHVIGDSVPGTKMILQAYDQKWVCKLEFADFNRLRPLFEKHHDASYGSIYPEGFQLNEKGYKYARYWLAYWEVLEAE